MFCSFYLLLYAFWQDLSENFIGLEGTLALSEAMKYNEGLIRLNLSKNNIDDTAGECLSQALQVCSRTYYVLSIQFQVVLKVTSWIRLELKSSMNLNYKKNAIKGTVSALCDIIRADI